MKQTTNKLLLTLSLSFTSTFIGCMPVEEFKSEPPAQKQLTIDFTIDEGNDGSIDSQIAMTVDEYGIPISISGHETDMAIENNDDVITITEVWSGDTIAVSYSEGRVIKLTIDELSDGDFDDIMEFVYHDGQKMDYITEDHNGDGNFDRKIIVKSWGQDVRNGFYSDIEDIFASIIIHSIEIDEDSDGNFDSIKTYTYNEKDAILRIDFDNDGDDIPDTSQFFNHTYTYDNNGNVITHTEDDLSNGEGTDYQWTYTYDAFNNKTSELIEYVQSGYNPTKNIWIYDERGNMIREELSVSEFSDPDSIKTWLYNDNNLMIQYSFTDDQWEYDGVSTINYEYDGKDNIVKAFKDYDGDRSVYEQVIIRTYSSENILESVSYDGDGRYSKDNAPLRKADGIIDTVKTYTLTGDKSIFQRYYSQQFDLDLFW